MTTINIINICIIHFSIVHHAPPPTVSINHNKVQSSWGHWACGWAKFPFLEVMPWSRSGIQDLIDSSFQFRGQFLHNFKSLKGIEQLSCITSTNQSRISMLILNRPSKSKMSQLTIQFLLGKIGQLLQITQVLLCGVVIIVERLQQLDRKCAIFIVKPINLILSQSFKVFTSQETTSKGTPSNQSIVVFLVKPQVFNFILLPSKHVVFVLGTDRLVQVESFANSQSVKDTLSIPVRCGPVESFTCLDNFVEGATYLLQRGQVVVMMGVQDVHVVQLEALERAFNTLADVFATDEVIRVDIGLRSQSNLSCNHHIFPGNCQIFENFAQLKLGLASSIDLSSIKMVDAILQSSLKHQFISLICFSTIIDHITKRDC